MNKQTPKEMLEEIEYASVGLVRVIAVFGLVLSQAVDEMKEMNQAMKETNKLLKEIKRAKS